MAIEFCKNDVISAVHNRLTALQQVIVDNQTVIDSKREKFSLFREVARRRPMTADEYKALYPIAKTDNDFVSENAQIAAKRQQIETANQGNSPFKYILVTGLSRDIEMIEGIKDRAIQADTEARTVGLKTAMNEVQFSALYPLPTEFPDEQTAINEADREADKLGQFLASGTGQFEGYFDVSFLNGTQVKP
jgi:hypothetical protein